MKPSTSDFGFIRKNFFPIHNHELKKLIPLTLMFFFVAFNYAVLRGYKDVLIAGGGGGTLTSKVKIFAVIPLMVILKFAYDYLNARYNPKVCFFVVMGYFAAFYTFYAVMVWLFPSLIKVEEKAEDWTIVTLGKNWLNVLFYANAEAVGTFGMSVSLWGFFGQVIPKTQSKRFFSQMMLGAAVATTLGGVIVLGLPKWFPKKDKEKVYQGVFVIVGAVLLSSALLLTIYHYLTKKMEADPEGYSLPQKKKKKKKKKLSISESINVFRNSEDGGYLFLILSLVLCYAIGINLLEGVWKDAVKGVNDNMNYNATDAEKFDFSSHIFGWQLIYIGLFSIVLILVLSPLVMRQGWRFAALVLPVVFLVGVVLFFGAAFFPDKFESTAAWFYKGSKYDRGLAKNTHTLVVFIGLAIVVIVKSSKYVFFDPTKEATYLPLDTQTRLVGKSAVDGIGSRFGKAGGGFHCIYLHHPWRASL